MIDIIKFSVNYMDEKKAKIEFELSESLEPSHLKTIKPPDVVNNGLGTKLVILSGRGPIWLYGFLIHHFHPCKAIAIFDPRLNGAVVVESHSKEYSIGDIIS